VGVRVGEERLTPFFSLPPPYNIIIAEISKKVKYLLLIVKHLTGQLRVCYNIEKEKKLKKLKIIWFKKF
jgi:hypothetical protein